MKRSTATRARADKDAQARRERLEKRRARNAARREKLIAKHRAQLVRRGFDLGEQEVRQRGALILRAHGVAFDEITSRYWVRAEYERDEEGRERYDRKPIRETVQATVRAHRWKTYSIPGLGTGRMQSEVASATAASFPAALIELRHWAEKHGRPS